MGDYRKLGMSKKPLHEMTISELVDYEGDWEYDRLSKDDLKQWAKAIINELNRLDAKDKKHKEKIICEGAYYWNPHRHAVKKFLKDRFEITEDEINGT